MINSSVEGRKISAYERKRTAFIKTID